MNDCQIFVDAWQVYYPTADTQVLQFIYNFLMHGGEENAEVIRNQFQNGYCYYFARMLQTAFNRGTVCIAAPIGHFVWLDENQVPYDIEGVNESDCDEYIPESFLGDMIQDFMHVSGVAHNTTSEEIQELIRRYRASK